MTAREYSAGIKMLSCASIDDLRGCPDAADRAEVLGVLWPITFMKRMIVLGLALLLPAMVRGGTGETTAGPKPGTNGTAVPEGWLQLPSRELVLDLRHESLEYGARRDAGEFLDAVLNVLLEANYHVLLSDEFILDEIKYYRTNLTREAPIQMSDAILACLEKARASGVLDWDSFKQIPRPGMVATERHLPWMGPPFKARAISLGGAEATNFACLHLSLKWAGRSYGGAVQFSRRPGGLPGERVLLQGEKALWAFAAVMRLEKGGQTLFEKGYPQDEWQRTYVTILDQPAPKATQAILRDLITGLKAKTVPVPGPSGKKSRRSRTPTPLDPGLQQQ